MAQPRLRWAQRNGAWFAAASGDCYLGVVLWIFDHTIEIVGHTCEAVEVWSREYPDRRDIVDAMVFAETRALSVCHAMFGRLLKEQ